MIFKPKTSASSLPRADDGDKETRRRHRLSKPLTNKSSTTFSARSAQHTGSLASNGSVLDISPVSLSTTTSHENVWEAVHTPASNRQPDMLRNKTSVEKDAEWNGTAFILDEGPVHGVDSPKLLSPVGSLKAKRPLSAIFTSPFSGNRRASDFAQRRASLQSLAEGVPGKTEKNGSTATLPGSFENQHDPLSPRLQRRSSFTPGVATRTSRIASLGPSPEEEEPNADDDCACYNPTLSEELPPSQADVLDFDEEWAPPAPPVARSVTPSDLDYTHLGGLRLGSLHVVNGRASPAPSELSRHLAGASTPNLRCDASSNYGDSEEGAVATLASLRLKSYRGRDQGLQDFATVPRKPVVTPMRTHSDTILLPKRTKLNGETPYSQREPDSSWTSVRSPDMPSPRTVSHSPDKTSELAMAYMAELSASPYSGERATSPTGSVLMSTSKATEFEDNLFDDDGENLFISEETNNLPSTTHDSSNDTVWMYENAYSLSVKRSRETSPRSSLQPSNSTGSSASVKPDSGYGSKISLESAGKRTHDTADKAACPMPNEMATQAQPMHTETTRGRSEPWRNSMLQRPSILKRSGSSAAELPSFPNLYSSTTTLATIKSTSSAPSDAPAKLRKLQKKARPRSQPPPVRQIVIQGQHRDVSNGDVPPIPAEIAANLAIRTQQIPELGHTFSSMNHTRQIESSPDQLYVRTYVDFPSIDPSPHDSLTEVNLPTPPPHRSSFVKWSKSGRRNSQRRISNTSGISESDAMAIICDLDTAVSSMGGSPYEVASMATKPLVSQPPQSKAPANPDISTRGSSRPKAMMDDATAAELARLRSRTIVERDGIPWNQRRSSFNDRGGIPGRNIRPLSAAGDAPPLPPLPSREQVRQREVGKTDYQGPYLGTRSERKHWPEQSSSDLYELAVEPQPSYAPPPTPFELEGDRPPLPPSHSPRPKDIETWEEAPTPLSPSHSARPQMTLGANEVFAPPPPFHAPCPLPFEPPEDGTAMWAAQASAWQSRRKSIGEMLRSRTLTQEQQLYVQPFPAHESAIGDPIYPEIPLRHPENPFPTRPEEYPTSRLQIYGTQPQPTLHEPGGRSCPSYDSFPNHTTIPERSQQRPQFGRYSGGFSYEYEHGAGFGGSAGTRSGSGAANATRKSVPLSESFGVDLSDVPIITKIRRKPVGCQ